MNTAKVVEYKMYICKSVAFLYTNSKTIRKGNEENNSIYRCIKKNKIQRNKSEEEETWKTMRH